MNFEKNHPLLVERLFIKELKIKKEPRKTGIQENVIINPIVKMYNREC
jgi:hypothetical protein